MMIVKSKYL